MFMKTRSNMPLFVVECSDVKALSKSQIDLLRCGDYLVKKDESGSHAYKVTYKKDKVGICLTYVDGSGYMETVSYDYTDGEWVYNSKDVTQVPSDEHIVSMLEDKDVKVKTLSQSEANWSIDISSINLGYDETKFSISGKYAKFEVVNGVLYFVLSYGITNITEETQSFNPEFIAYADLRTMPDAIAEKIIDAKGNNLKYVNSQASITSCHGFATYGIGVGEVRGNTILSLGFMNYAGTTSDGSMQIRCSVNSAWNLNAGQSTAISFRTFLTIL